MKHLLVFIVFSMFSMLATAQEINPDSALINPDGQYHDEDWWNQRYKIASVKAIKEFSKDVYHSYLVAMREAVGKMNKADSLIKANPLFVYTDGNIQKYLNSLNKDMKEQVKDYRELFPYLKSDYLYVKNFKGKVKTKRLIEAAKNIAVSSSIMKSDAIMVNADATSIILQFGLYDIK